MSSVLGKQMIIIRVKKEGAPKVLRTRPIIAEALIYKDGELSMIHAPEGYSTESGGLYLHHYYLKDHLENNRVQCLIKIMWLKKQ